MECKARQYVNAGKCKTHNDGSPYFEPSKKYFGPLHHGSSANDQSNYILFDDDSVVNMVNDCVISVYDNLNKRFA